MDRHKTFESITKNVDVQNALRDLYDHPDKVELYPGVFCESNEIKSLDPGPSKVDSALWAAIFSDAITLVRSDRFYTVVSLSLCQKMHEETLTVDSGLEHKLSDIMGHEGSHARS